MRQSTQATTMRKGAKMKADLRTSIVGAAFLSGLVSFGAGCDSDCGIFPEGTDLDGDGFACEADCNDLSAAIYPGAPEVCDGWDNDCDGVVPIPELDQDGDGYRNCGGPGLQDCAPTWAHVHPGAPEFCDGMDNDCDPSTPRWPGEDIDADGDGAAACEDCDDTDPNVYPDRYEDCDGVDSNCNGIGDAWGPDWLGLIATDAEEQVTVGFAANHYAIGSSIALERFSQRLTGFSSSFNDPSPRLLVYHWASGHWELEHASVLLPPQSGEWWTTQPDLRIALQAGEEYLIGASGMFGSTHARVLEGESELEIATATSSHGFVAPAGMPQTFGQGDLSELPGHYAQSWVWRQPSEIDLDGDGILMCLDCDDAGAEVCDGFDGDCDGSPDPSEVDYDLDGFVDCTGDCDPADYGTAPLRWEACDGVDSNCLPEGESGDESDLDGDGFAPCDGDCDDSDPTVYPGAPELCDDIDQDCDGDEDDWRTDNDGDGVWDCFDCMPNSPNAAPGLADSCTSSVYDFNCDGVFGPGVDVDGDGVTDCEGDCDDNNVLVHPGMNEIDGDGVDNDCDGEVDGFAPAVRVTFDNLEVDTMETFWAPADIRRPRTRGDYAVFTRAADGTIVDLEAFDYNPLLVGVDSVSPPTWLDATGQYRFSGTLWLDATDAAQVVVATIDPYQEVSVRLVPEAPAPPAAAGLGVGPSVAECDALDDGSTPDDMLETMHDYFPWIVFNDGASFEEVSQLTALNWTCQGSLPPVPEPEDYEQALCFATPTPSEIVATCRALAQSSDHVAGAVSRVSWWWHDIGRGLGTGDIILPTEGHGSVEASYLRTVAHEAAHVFHYQGNYVSQYPPGAVLDFVSSLESTYAHRMDDLSGAFTSLVESAVDHSEILCTDTPTYSLGMPTVSTSYVLPDWLPQEPAWECGFALRPYGQLTPSEDIADWAALAVLDTDRGEPWAFCDRLGGSLDAVPNDLILNYAKALMLHMGGFLSQEVSEGCFQAMVPWDATTPGVPRAFTLGSDPDFDFDVPVSFATFSPGELDVFATQADVWVHLEHTEIDQGSLFGVIVPLDLEETGPPGVLEVDPDTDTKSYFQRAQSSTVVPGPGCLTADGVEGRSINGSALVLNNDVQTVGLVFPTRIGCGHCDPTPPANQDCSSGSSDWDFRTDDGGIVAFQIPSTPSP